MAITRTSTAGKSKRSSAGFTYVMVLVAVVVIGLMAGVGSALSSRAVKADREQELLFRGLAYKEAIRRYYAVSKTFPRALDDLLKDPRFANHRYLRAAYPDPMGVGKKEWTLVRAPDGGIAGVASASQAIPLKQANFPVGLETFQGAKTYADWIFQYVPMPAPSSTPGIPSAPSARPPVLHVN